MSGIRINLWLLLFWGLGLQASSQEYTLRGQVIHGGTGAPLSYANVALLNETVGTITNEDGQFYLTLGEEHLNGTLAISFLGFETHTAQVKEVLGQPLTVALQPSSTTLREVVVTPEDPREIVRKAYANIPKNYITTPYYLNGFCREWARDPDGGRLKEAQLKIYKPQFRLEDKPKDREMLIEALRGRQFDLLTPDEENEKLVNLFSTMHQITRSEPSRNPESFMHGKDMEKNYEYHLLGYQKNGDGTELYVIAFDQKDKVKDKLLAGTLWIQAETYALVKAEYGLSKKGNINRVIPAATRALVRLFGLELDLHEFKVSWEYSPYGDKWFLKQHSLVFDLNFNRPRKNVTYPITLFTYFTTTGLQTTGVKPFPESEVMTSETQLDSAAAPYNPAYWDGYTYLPPSRRIQEIIDQLASSKRNDKATKP